LTVIIQAKNRPISAKTVFLQMTLIDSIVLFPKKYVAKKAEFLE
jgi:hypothetical protein